MLLKILGGYTIPCRLVAPPQLVDMFLSEKWSDYVSEYPVLSERHKLVSPHMVHGLLTRWICTQICPFSNNNNVCQGMVCVMTCWWNVFSLYLCSSSVCTCTCPYRLKEGEMKKKRKFHSQSTAKKERQKYYELILKKLEEFMAP